VTRDPNLSKIELIAAALGPLCGQLVFVGGCAVGLLITDAAAAPVRVTFDVDLVARVSALAAYHGIEKEFVRLGSVATQPVMLPSAAGDIVVLKST
jgi:hypothetical protein